MDRIKISEGITVNLGNYQSYRIDVEYARDFNGDNEDRDIIFKDIQDYVDKKLKERIKEKVNAKIVKEQ